MFVIFSASPTEVITKESVSRISLIVLTWLWTAKET